MNNLIKLKGLLSKEKEETNYVRSLCFVMEKVGGYEPLMELSLPALLEIFKATEYFEKEKAKSMNRKKK